MDYIFNSCSYIFIFSLMLKPAYPACSPVQEGSSTEIDCTVGDNTCPDNGLEIFFWSIYDPAANGGESFVSSCDMTSCYSLLSASTFEATITGSNPVYTSRLTINNVLRTFPMNLETEFTCKTSDGCGANSVTACDELEVYALPEAPSCSLGDIQDKDGDSVVTVTCSTDKVYPEADCQFYHYKDSQQVVGAIQRSGTQTGQPYSDPVYFSYQCNVDYRVEDLGEGTHTFVGRMYPRVTGGDSLTGVVNTPADRSLLFALPSTEYSCTTEQKDGYFKGRSATCTCSLVSEVYPEATPQWYKDGVQIQTTGEGLATLTFDTSDPTAEFACKGISALGVSQGSTVVQDFAFLDTESVEVVVSPSTTINLCGNNNNKITVTCQIHKDNGNPELTTSFSIDGITFIDPNSAQLVGDYYQSIFSLQPDQGGLIQVWCRAQNSIFSDMKEDKTTTDLTFNKPPSDAPKVTIQGQPYQDTDSSTHSVTLTEGFTGDFTCEVKGGYPTVYDTRLECGQMDMTGATDSSTLSFQTDPMTRDMDGVTCSCTAQHVSGCYNLETSVTLNVQYKPTVTLTSSKTDLEEGQSTTLTCQSEGNPPPSLTLTRDRAGDVLSPLTSSTTKTASIDEPLNEVGCLDTDTYVCTASNDVGSNTSSVEIFVKCPQHLSQPVNVTPIIDVVIGETTTFSVEIYGYPQPTDISLTRLIGGSYQPAPDRQTVLYIPSTPPYGSIEVTLTDMTPEDYTNYIITVDNNAEEALVYSFTTNEVNATLSPAPSSESGGSDNTVTIVAVLVSASLIILLVVAVIFLIRRKQRRHRNEKENNNGTNLTSLAPSPGHVTSTSPSGQVQVSSGPYETIPDPSYANQPGQELRSSRVDDRTREQQDGQESGPYVTPIDASPDHVITATRQPQPSNHYETIPDPSYTNLLGKESTLGHLGQQQEHGVYDRTSEPDIEPPNVYQRMRQPRIDDYVNVDGPMARTNGVYNNVSNYQNVTLGISDIRNRLL